MTVTSTTSTVTCVERKVEDAEILKRSSRQRKLLPTDHTSRKRESTPPVPPGKRIAPGKTESGLGKQKSGAAGRRKEHPDVDGGWAWMILFAACLDYFIVELSYSPAGLYTTTFKEVFEKDAFVISWLTAVPGALVATAGMST